MELKTDLKADLAYLCRQYLMTVRKDMVLTLAIQLLVSRPALVVGRLTSNISGAASVIASHAKCLSYSVF